MRVSVDVNGGFPSPSDPVMSKAAAPKDSWSVTAAQAQAAAAGGGSSSSSSSSVIDAAKSAAAAAPAPPVPMTAKEKI